MRKNNFVECIRKLVTAMSVLPLNELHDYIVAYCAAHDKNIDEGYELFWQEYHIYCEYITILNKGENYAIRKM